MSYFLRILCRSDWSPSLEHVKEFVEEGSYFEDDPQIIGPEDNDPASSEPGRITIRYAKRKRPVVISTSTGPALKEELDDIREAVEDLPPDQAAPVMAHFDQTVRIIAIEIDRERLSEEAWEMVDALQANFASHGDGIIYAPDDGFYDASLKPIAKL